MPRHASTAGEGNGFTCSTVKRVTYRGAVLWRLPVPPTVLAVFTAHLTALEASLALLPPGRFCAVNQIGERGVGWRLDAHTAAAILDASAQLREVEIAPGASRVQTQAGEPAQHAARIAALAFVPDKGIVATGVEWSEAARRRFRSEGVIHLAVLLEQRPAPRVPVRLLSASVVVAPEAAAPRGAMTLAHFAERISPPMKAHLPKTAIELVRVLGWQGAASLICRLGGRKFPVPKAAGNNPDGSRRYAQLVDAVGEAGAACLVAEHGGQVVTIPSCASALEREAFLARDRAICARYNEGATIENLVCEFGLSGRRISQLLKKQAHRGAPPLIASPHEPSLDGSVPVPRPLE